METTKLKVRVVWSELDIFNDPDIEGQFEEMSLVTDQYHSKTVLLDNRFSEFLAELEKKYSVQFGRLISDCFYQLSLENLDDAAHVARHVMADVESHLGA